MNTTQTLVSLTPKDITERVMTTNSFTKAEMAAHKAQITDARKVKREGLALWDGAKLGSFAAEAMQRGAVVKDIRTRTSSKQQTWTIKLVAPIHATPADALKAKIKRAAERLNELEEQFSKESATAV